jgi:hypothetical protein
MTTKTKNILIGTPNLGSVHSEYTLSLFNTTSLVSQLKDVNINICFVSHQLTQRARNRITDYFLDHDEYTHLFFIDSDIAWKAEDFIKLARHDEPIVCGLYPNKRIFWDRIKYGKDFMTNFSSVVSKQDLENFNPKTNLSNINKAATGFLLIEKSVFKQLEDLVEEFEEDGKICRDYWNCKIVNKKWLTEDYYFSHLCKTKGISVKCDYSIVLAHVGEFGYSTNPMVYFGLNNTVKETKPSTKPSLTKVIEKESEFEDTI